MLIYLLPEVEPKESEQNDPKRHHRGVVTLDFIKNETQRRKSFCKRGGGNPNEKCE